mmetsp:Transcript_132141/g.257473  ORF Transcript_132141/g.257473 Transcript_132141/m.257473 type:complete len:94 (-) Transcript_132141:15-296(-)
MILLERCENPGCIMGRCSSHRCCTVAVMPCLMEHERQRRISAEVASAGSRSSRSLHQLLQQPGADAACGLHASHIMQVYRRTAISVESLCLAC